MSDHVSLRFALLDNDMIDAEGRPIGRVDDVQLQTAPGAARVTALLTGAEALGQRLGGGSGRLMASTAARLRANGEPPGPAAIPVGHVERLEPLVALSVRLADLPHVAGLERWLAHHVIENIRGAGDARE